MEKIIEAVSTEVGTESAVETTTDQSQETPEIDVSELQAQLDAIKKAQQGSDRRVSALEKEKAALLAEKEELLKTSMSAEEKLEYEKQLFEQKQKDFESREKALKTEALKNEFMLDNKIDRKLSKYIHGETLEELEESAADLMEGIKTEAENIVKQKYAKSPPVKGETDSKGDKTIKRADFDSLDVMTQAKYISDGYKVT